MADKNQRSLTDRAEFTAWTLANRKCTDLVFADRKFCSFQSLYTGAPSVTSETYLQSASPAAVSATVASGDVGVFPSTFSMALQVRVQPCLNVGGLYVFQNNVYIECFKIFNYHGILL